MYGVRPKYVQPMQGSLKRPWHKQSQTGEKTQMEIAPQYIFEVFMMCPEEVDVQKAGSTMILRRIFVIPSSPVFPFLSRQTKNRAQLR